MASSAIVACVVVRLLEHFDRLFEVDDMNPFPFGEDVACHLRIPLARSMPEVHTRLEQFLHR